MRDELARLGVGHLVHLLEALDEVAAAELLVRQIDRAVAVQAGAGLLDDLLALGERLVVEHVGVAALLAEVDREGVAVPHRLQARILLDPRLGDDRARIGGGRRARDRLAAAEAGAHLVDGPLVAVVLQREVLAPDRRVLGLVGELDDAEERVLRLLLVLEDVHQQAGDDGAGDGGDGGQQKESPAADGDRGLGFLPVVHGDLLVSQGARVSRGVQVLLVTGRG